MNRRRSWPRPTSMPEVPSCQQRGLKVERASWLLQSANRIGHIRLALLDRVNSRGWLFLRFFGHVLDHAVASWSLKRLPALYALGHSAWAYPEDAGELRNG